MARAQRAPTELLAAPPKQLRETGEGSVSPTHRARLHKACEVVGISARTLQRWEAHQGLDSGDGRPGAQRPASSSQRLAVASSSALGTTSCTRPAFNAVAASALLPYLKPST